MITCTLESGRQTSLRHVVVHAIVEGEGKLLLVKRSPDILEGGKYALPGGFLDRDETAVGGVLRELKEETGLKGEVISLFRINTNPNRPHEDRQNVALDFLVRPIRQVVLMDKETTSVEWIPLDRLPSLDSLAFDHGESIKLYLKYQQSPFSLPIFK